MKSLSRKSVAVGITCKPELYEILRRIAAQEYRSVSAVFVVAAQEYVRATYPAYWEPTAGGGRAALENAACQPEPFVSRLWFEPSAFIT